MPLTRLPARIAFKVAVYFLRRACNRSLREVARLAGVSPSRISRIQVELEQDNQVETIDRLIRPCRAPALLHDCVRSSTAPGLL